MAPISINFKRDWNSWSAHGVSLPLFMPDCQVECLTATWCATHGSEAVLRSCVNAADSTSSRGDQILTGTFEELISDSAMACFFSAGKICRRIRCRSAPHGPKLGDLTETPEDMLPARLEHENETRPLGHKRVCCHGLRDHLRS